MQWPIDPEIIHKNAYLPVKLTELSRIDPDAALELLQAWGEGTKPVCDLWEIATNKLAAVSA